MMQHSPFSGRWVNDRGSTLELQVSPNGTIAGFFRSAVGEVDPGSIYPVTGYCTDQTIGFVVKFREDLCSWAGHLYREPGSDPGALFFEASWHLARDRKEMRDQRRYWNGIHSGVDHFAAVEEPERGDAALGRT
jgi:hypothetical protein